MIRQILKLFFNGCIMSLISSLCLGQGIKYGHIEGDIDSIVKNQIMIKNNDSIQPKVSSRTVSFFNKKGLLVEDRTYPYETIQQFNITDAKPLRDIKNYDDKGVLLETISHDSSGTPIWRSVYTYNPSASLIEFKDYYLPSKSLATITKLLLDKKGNIVDESSYDGIGKLTYKHRYKYDADNYCIENVEINPETLKEYKTIFNYANGNLIKETNYDEFGEVQSTYMYKYTKYDEKHNWMVQKLYINGRLCKIEERTIIYRK